MPYFIRKFKTGYAVYVHGKKLSKKPLSLATAKKQRIAVILSEGRRRKAVKK